MYYIFYQVLFSFQSASKREVYHIFAYYITPILILLLLIRFIPKLIGNINKFMLKEKIKYPVFKIFTNIIFYLGLIIILTYVTYFSLRNWADSELFISNLFFFFNVR